MSETKNQTDHSSVTVIVQRRIRPGFEGRFEDLMREFVKFALSFPGHEDIHIFRPDKDSRTYMVVDRFSSWDSRRAFTESATYREWMRQLKAVTEGDPSIKEMEGLAGWFTLPERPCMKPPVKYKMAMVTFMGVYPVTSILSPLLNPFISVWHPLLANVVFSGLVVILLTWIVMPLLTRLLQSWLFTETVVPADRRQK